MVTPSHNPPEDGGFKYNPPDGGPADTDVTRWIQDRANELLRAGNAGVARVPYERALRAATTHRDDLVLPYVRRSAERRRHGRHPRGRAPARRWIRSAARRGPTGSRSTRPTGSTSRSSTRRSIPTFAFMTVDHDGKIRMDCSSPYAMARLVGLKDRYRVAFANDPDSDRHGIVTPGAGLMNPNHYLAVAIAYLFTSRPDWPAGAAVGKTLVSSGLIDRVAPEARPPPLRGAGRIQVVRPRPARRLARLRRRGERRGQLPPARRHRVDDRQGRPDHGPARRRDHRAHRPGPRRALPGAGRRVRRRPCYTRIDAAGDARAEGPAGEAVARPR